MTQGDALRVIEEAAYRHGWCSRFGLPCDGGSRDCCGAHTYVVAVSLDHVRDVLTADPKDA